MELIQDYKAPVVNLSMPEEKHSSRISYTLIGNLFRAVISFVTSMFIARELAPENYEDIFLIGTFVALKQILDFSSSSYFSHSSLKEKKFKSLLKFIGLRCSITTFITTFFNSTSNPF